MNMPPVTLPREAALLNPHLAYVRKDSALKQAATWNRVLADNSTLGPGSGFVVGVGERCNGRYPLVWASVT